MDVLQLSILGFIEGITEFIPVSSTGHLIVARDILGVQTTSGLAVDAVLQLATACALLVYFRSDIMRLSKDALAILQGKPTQDAGLLAAILVGTAPAIALGLLLESTMETVFRSPHLVAWALLAGSVLFILAEQYLRRVAVPRSLSTLTWRDGLVIGLWQTVALVPGMSRSGMTMVGGMLNGFSRSDAARFGFLLSIPILCGSGLKKLYDLYAGGLLQSTGGDLFVGCLVAFFSGLLAIHILMQLVRHTPLTVFALYRAVLAVCILLFVP